MSEKSEKEKKIVTPVIPIMPVPPILPPILPLVFLKAFEDVVNVQKIMKDVTDLQQAIISPAIQLSQQLQQLLQSVREAMEEVTLISEPEFKRFEYNWLVFLPFPTLKRLYTLHKNGKDEEISKMLIELHRRKDYIDQLLESFKGSKIFAPRLGIIKDCLNAHLEGKHSLSIPAMLAQVEGILWDITEEEGIAKGTFIDTKKGTKKEAISAKPLVEETKIKDMLSDYLAEYFLKQVYTKDYRHAVLHGRLKTYPSEEGSMKLILILRALHKVLEV